MTVKINGNIEFPEFSGARCYMMPIIQGRGESVPDHLSSYREIVDSLFLSGECGKVGFITIDESFVKAGKSQRGYGAGDRTVHTEACLSGDTVSWGGIPTWGMNSPVLLDPDVKVIIANSIDDTCMAWDTEVFDTTPDGDLSDRLSKFPRQTGVMLKAGQVAEIGIFTPHECIEQKESKNRQFFRIVGSGVHGRTDKFTKNELVKVAA